MNEVNQFVKIEVDKPIRMIKLSSCSGGLVMPKHYLNDKVLSIGKRYKVYLEEIIDV
jgi:hypothetical protein